MKVLTNNARFETVDERPYKIYTALLNQEGETDPVATVLENTIGNIVWTRIEVGVYRGTLTGAFSSGKTIAILPLVPADDNNKISIVTVYNENIISIMTKETPSASDNCLYNTFIEIRVYN